MDATLMLLNVKIARGNEIILDNVNLRIGPGEFACIYGRSGSGKTSLLRVMALIDLPISGKVFIGEKDYAVSNVALRARVRRELIGYIPQHDNVIDELLVWENIGLPLLLKGIPENRVIQRVKEIASSLEIVELLDRSPRDLSGGQRRRITIARALLKDPIILLADEPMTGLDDELIKKVYQFFSDLARRGRVIVYATPDSSETPPCTKSYRIHGKRLIPL